MHGQDFVQPGRCRAVWLVAGGWCGMHTWRDMHTWRATRLSAPPVLCTVQVHAVGEIMLDVGAPHGWGPKRLTEDQLQVVLARLTSAAQEGGADVTLLRQGTTEVPGEGEQQYAQLLRQRSRLCGTCTLLQCACRGC
jgi:hypothetical protein